MIIVVGKKNFERHLVALHADAMKRVDGELAGIKSVVDLSARVKTLREEVEKLERDKAVQEDEIERREREIEHKIGLERKRQEFELESGKRDAVLKVREENLKADRDRFAEQMKFHNDRFTAEVGYLKEMLSEIVQRLPSAEFTVGATVTPAKRGR